MKKGIFAQLGEKGLALELLKIKTRKNQKSKTKVGDKKTITLAFPIILDCPIYRIRESMDSKPGRESLGIKTTSKVLGINILKEFNDGLTFKFKTEHSIYIGRFIK